MEITLERLKIIAGREGFNTAIIEKDYLVTYLLYLIKDVKGIYFKGGTALHKIILNHERLSEDLDFNLTRNINDVVKDIKLAVKGTIFDKITNGKDVDNFIRLIVHYKLFHEEGRIFIDLNERGKLTLNPSNYQINHFYKDIIPEFLVMCMNKEEVIAEKVMAAATRYRARDYADIYFILKKGLTVNFNLIELKSRENGENFEKINIFKNTNKIYKNWAKDLSPILREMLDFKEVMKFLSKHFKLKEEKEKKKQEN